MKGRDEMIRWIWNQNNNEMAILDLNSPPSIYFCDEAHDSKNRFILPNDPFDFMSWFGWIDLGKF